MHEKILIYYCNYNYSLHARQLTVYPMLKLLLLLQYAIRIQLLEYKYSERPTKKGRSDKLMFFRSLIFNSCILSSKKNFIKPI
jgi:hypothetical protein